MRAAVGAGPLRAHRFYLDVRRAAPARQLERRLAALGAIVEIFLSKTVTHVVTDNPKCGPATPNCHGSTAPEESPQISDHSVSPNPAKWGCGQRGVAYKSRTDAMLESVYSIQQPQSPSVLQQARLWNIPIWSYKKVERFLNEINALVQREVDLDVRVFKGSYIKFESLDRRNRAVYKEFSEWPKLNLAKEHSGSPFAPLDPKVEKKQSVAKDKSSDTRRKARTYKAKTNILDSDLRMTRKTRPRLRERTDIPPKQNGYCEICRASYSVLSDHERTSSHINFVKNGSNFLSLDALINDGTDVETFLKMNKSTLSNNFCERRSLRNIIKTNQEAETQNVQRQLQIVCNGNSDAVCKDMSPREGRRVHSNEQSPVIRPHLSPTNEKGHFLRSKGSNANEPENHRISPREGLRRDLRNGSLSPRIIPEKNHTKINGKIEERDVNRNSPLIKSSKARSIRWRRPSPDSNPPPPDNQTYYKVVGMSTKLRSSSNFVPTTQKDVEPVAPPPTRNYCNGVVDTGLVVKFKRVRRSELSVLSDEAENFMFPKKDDSESTEDEVETSYYSNNDAISDVLTSSNSGMRCKVKEELLSGDDLSQDSCASDTVGRKSRKRSRTEAFVKDNFENPKSDTKSKRHSKSNSPESNKINTDSSKEGEMIIPIQSPLPAPEKCLQWVGGRLKASPEVENLTYTFEQVPSCEPWYDAFKRQDDKQENAHSIAEYLGYYWKSPILPYEMGNLPPLKPNCCHLGQSRRTMEIKSSPSRLYGTRGMKKRKIKQEIIFSSSKNPRKSPREHASTLAILGSLIHKRRSKLSSSDDSKSLPSIAEEDASSDIPLFLKLPEISISDSSKKLEEFFSSMRDDEEYETLVENLDESIYIEKAAARPDVVDLLQNYDQCDLIENTAKEIQNDMQQRDGRRRRKGCRLKKKNKTGWPAKKRVQVKRERASSVNSSRDTSVNRDIVDSEELSSAVLEETRFSVGKVESQLKDTRVDKIKSQNVNYLVLENNENSITSFSDIDEKLSVSSKCKVTDTECSNSEDEALSSKSRRWKSSDRSEHSKELQPVVRVQKIDTKGGATGAGGKRKLRSSGSQRKLRGRSYR